MEYQCCICLDRLLTANVEVSVTPCCHAFHKNCISKLKRGNDKKCPKCRTECREDELNKVHFDVFKDLDYSDCSSETINFFEDIRNHEEEKKITMVKIIKKLDKENTSLKEAYKNNQESYRTCKLFLKGFKKEIKDLPEKSAKLKQTNNLLLAKIRRLLNEKEDVNEEEESKIVEREEIDERTGEDAINNIEAIINIFEGSNNEDGKDKILEYNVNTTLNRKILHEGLFEEVEKNMKELHEHDVKVNDLMLSKIVKLHTDNKALRENNDKLNIQVKILQNSLKAAQNKAECMKESYQNLQSKNEELLDHLEVTNKVKEVGSIPVKKSSKTSFDNTHDEDAESNEVNSYIYISGGVTAEYSLNEYVLQMDNKLRIQACFKNEKTARHDHKSIVKGNQMYLIGGHNGHELVDTDIVPVGKQLPTHTFPSMHNKRQSFGICSFADCVFVGGGAQIYFKALNKCEVYSFESREWTEVSSMNKRRCLFTLTHFQGQIWAVGGFDASNSIKTCYDSIETFDLATNKWTTSNLKLITKRCGHSTVAHRKKLFVIGGKNRLYDISSVEVYSRVTNEFTFVAPMNIARHQFGCCVINSKVYVIGGFKDCNYTDNCFNLTNEVEVYDIEKNEWRRGPNLPFELSCFACSETL